MPSFTHTLPGRITQLHISTSC